MRRVIALSTFTILTTFLSISQASANSVNLALEDACGGDGFSGVLADETVSVEFVACSTPAGGFAKVFDESGATLTEVTLDEEAETIILKIGGTIDDPENTSSTEWTAFHSVIDDSPGRSLFEQHVWSQLRSKGISVQSN